MYYSVFILIQRNLIAYNLSNFFSLCSFSTPTRYKTIWNIYLSSSFSNSFRLICTQNLLTHIMNVKAHTKTHTHIVSECFNINLLSHTLSTDLREKNTREMNENLPMRNECLEDLIFHLLFFSFSSFFRK